MTAKEAANLVAYLLALYPNQKFQPATIMAYQQELAALDNEEATRAVRDLVSTERFCPNVAMIKRRVAELLVDAPSVSVAWEQFSDKDAEQHPLVKRVGKTLGGRFAYQASGNYEAFRAHFMKLYADMLEETVVRVARGQPAFVQIERAQILEIEAAPEEPKGDLPPQVRAALEKGAGFDFAKLTKDLTQE